MTTLIASSCGVRMLSPPYSPRVDGHHPDDGTKDQVDVSKPIATDKASNLRIRSAKDLSGSSTSSVLSSTASDDELTDNDDLDLSDENSGSVPPEDELLTTVTRKRLASEALVDDGYSNSGLPIARERRMTTCWDALKTNPVKYLRQERSMLNLYPLRRHSWAGPGSLGFCASDDGSSADSGSSAPTTNSESGLPRTYGRGRRAQRSPNNNGSGNSFGWRGRRRATAESSTQSTRDSEADGSSKTTPAGTSVQVGNASTRVHDISYNQLEDYSPSVHTLPPGKSLRAEWKGAPMDLSGDPDLPLLHPAEVHLASVLRLPCDVYLDSKRRLFAEKVHRLRQGLPFRRTDSQKACRIDVNKASRLFGAFEKIGWLEDGLFFNHLN